MDERDEGGHLDEGQTEAAARDVDTPVISLRDVHLAYDRPILKGVTFDLSPGTTKILLGGSGSGKSTILRLLLGLLKADSGSIVVDGTEVTSLSEEEMRDVRLKIGMVFQEGALFDSLTVGQNVGYRFIEDGQLDEGEIEARVREMLGFVGLATHYEKMPSDLSGGQKRRVAFARALVARPQIMFYDEPTTGLDPITATTITDLICKVRDLDGVSSPRHPSAPRRLQRGADVHDQEGRRIRHERRGRHLNARGHRVHDVAGGDGRVSRLPVRATDVDGPVYPGVPVLRLERARRHVEQGGAA